MTLWKNVKKRHICDEFHLHKSLFTSEPFDPFVVVVFLSASFIHLKKIKSQKKKTKKNQKFFEPKKLPSRLCTIPNVLQSKKATDQIVYHSKCVLVQILPWQNCGLSQTCFGSDFGLGQICFRISYISSLNCLLDKIKLSKKLNNWIIHQNKTKKIIKLLF